MHVENGHYLEPVYMEVEDPRQVRPPAEGSPHLSCKRDQINIKFIWAGGLPHLSGLFNLPGVPHLHVNRSLVMISNTGH